MRAHSTPRGNFTHLYLNMEEKHAEEYNELSQGYYRLSANQNVFFIKYIKCGDKKRKKKEKKCNLGFYITKRGKIQYILISKSICNWYFN